MLFLVFDQLRKLVDDISLQVSMFSVQLCPISVASFRMGFQGVYALFVSRQMLLLGSPKFFRDDPKGEKRDA